MTEIVKIFTFFCFLISAVITTDVYAQNISPDSRVSAVTVYPGSARVTREAKVSLTAGTHSIVFENIIPLIDENSLTVTAEGTAKVKIFGGYLKQKYLKESADKRVKDLQSEIEALQDELTIEQSRAGIIADQKEFLKSLKLHADNQLPKELVTKMPTSLELDEMIKFIGTSREGLETANEEIRVKMRDLNRNMDKLNAELSSLNSGVQKMQRSIVVDVDCLQAGTLNVRISYMVGGAHWSALYDARADLDKREIELTSFGSILQKTGEDWNDVAVTLSTAQPTVSGRMPYVDSWLLSELQVYPQSIGKSRMRGQVVAADKLVEGVQYEAFNLATAPMVAEEKADNAYAQAQQSGVSVTYQLTRPVSILSDGTESKFPINTQILKSNFEYSAYPRISEFAYLGSRVVNAQDFQLLNGPVNLFLGNEFVGKSSIDAIGPGQDFDLYLGIDENVKIKRELLEKKIDDTLIAGIQSPNRKIIYKYKLSVENFTSKTAAFKLFEAMPVSQNDKIKVKVYDVSLAPTTKDWKDRKGVWLWELNLVSKQKQEIVYTIMVEYPREMNIGGL